MDQTINQSSSAQGFLNQAPVVDSLSCYCKVEPGLGSKLCNKPDVNRDAHKPKYRQRERTRHQPLLPGLPDDLAIACLVRVPRAQHYKLRAVCKKWLRLVSGNFYYTLRKSLGLSEEWVYVIKQDRDGKISWTAFDPVLKSWHPLPPIPGDFGRAIGFGCAVLSGCHLYLFGGRDGLMGSTRRAIVYNACTNRWHRVPDMLRKRSYFSCCVMNNCIYVVGGVCEGTQRVLRSGEVYDPSKNCWNIIADMGTVMVPYVSVVYNGKWFLKGRGSHREAQSEAYVPETGTWAPVRDGMVVGLRNPSVVMNGSLYCLDCRVGCRLKVFEESSSTWKVFVDSELHLGNNRALGVAALVPLNGKLCIVHNDMSISMVDVLSTDDRFECNPRIWEHIGGNSHTRNRFTSLWSSLAGRGGSKSHIIHCEVLRA